MIKILYYILLLAAPLAILSCDDFLDVTPSDSLTTEQVEMSEEAINSVLNGIYMNMGKTALYGGDLTKSTMDVLAQRYTFTSDNTYKWYKYSQYEYNEPEVQATFENIWAAAYTQILGINEFITIVNGAQVTIPQSRKDILLGEAYALRAFHHFDLLRIFGPVYSTGDSTVVCIPYNDQPGAELQPQLPANQVMAKVLADLGKAESLLRNDPIIASGIMDTTINDPLTSFYVHRNYRMNYYAVKALQARAYLWQGDKTNAWLAAKTVIDAQQNKKYFDWLPYQNIIRGENPDRVFSTEVIFGLDNRNYDSKTNPDMYTQQDAFFSASLQEKSLLYTRQNRLVGVAGWFENESDYRYKYLWLISSTAGKSYRTFFKYDKPSDVLLKFAYFQPLIRITEMYYIMAESDPNYSVGAEYINKVRPNRGLNPVSVASRAALNAQLQKEYIREFYGEGQLFFYYKRLNLANIDDGSLDIGTISMTSSKYCVPIPFTETSRR